MTHSAFYPRSVCVCVCVCVDSDYLSQQLLLVYFLMEVLGVLLEVGTEFLYVIYMKVILKKFDLNKVPKMVSSQFLHNAIPSIVIPEFSPETLTGQLVSSGAYTS